jgi:hypothetical protein
MNVPGYDSTVVVANTAGVLLGVVGAAAASVNSAKILEGRLRSISVGSDSTAVTITVYDALSATGSPRFTAVVPSGWSECFILDLRLDTGLFVVIAGGTTPTITLAYV